VAQGRHPLLDRRVRWALAFLLPGLFVALAVAGWPLARTVALSFTDAQLGAFEAPAWIGIENYVWILSDPDWWRAVANTLVFTVVSVSLELALGLGFALLLDSALPGQGALRALALVPWAVPTVVAGRMWAWMYHDIYGVVNELLLAAGVITKPVAWLAEPATALAAVIMADVWKATPFVTLLLLAGLQTVPRPLLDAARVDGAGPVRRLIHVILPLLAPAILVAAVFRTLDALRVFDLIYVMTSNSRDTASISVYARQYLIDFQEVGLGSAASVLVFALVAAAGVAYVRALAPAMRPAP